MLPNNIMIALARYTEAVQDLTMVGAAPVADRCEIEEEYKASREELIALIEQHGKRN